MTDTGTDELTAVIISVGHDKPVGDKPAPLAQVAGLRLIERLIKSVRHCGAGRLRLVVGPDSSGVVEVARDVWPENGTFKVVEVDSSASDSDALRAAVTGDDRQVLVLFADTTFSLNILQGLLQDGLGDRRALVAGDSRRFAGLAMLTGKLAGSLSAGLTLAEALGRAKEVGEIGYRPLGNSFTHRIAEKEDIQKAEKMHMKALRRPGDGIISRLLNRPVSLFLTRHVFLRLPLTPNHITFLAGVIGWAAIVIMFLWPGYWWVLLGAFLFHISSVLDGCDGEVARLRFQFSRFGEWFDNVLDEFNNAAFIAGIGVGAYLAGGHPAYAWAAGFYFLAIAVCDSASFHQLVYRWGGTGNFAKFQWFFQKPESGPPPDPTAMPQKRSLSSYLMDLPRRDFYIFVLLILAAVDCLLYGFWLAVAVGAALFVLGILQWIHQIKHPKGRTS